jgi:hypothetical protein
MYISIEAKSTPKQCGLDILLFQQIFVELLLCGLYCTGVYKSEHDGILDLEVTIQISGI